LVAGVGKLVAAPTGAWNSAMTALSGDLRALIETDQTAARLLLADLVARLPHSTEARALLANSHLRSLEVAARARALPRRARASSASRPTLTTSARPASPMSTPMSPTPRCIAV